MNEAFLSVEDLALARGEAILFAGLSFAVAPGDIVWLQGPNGSGKSSLLRALAGFLSPMAGRIVRQGRPQDMIAYIGHKDGFTERSRIGDEARFWGLGDGALAGMMSPAPDPARRISTLSAGQRRRLQLAIIERRARPVWLLDEPFAALDAGGVRQLSRRIVERAAGGGAAVIASHRGLPEFGREVTRIRLVTEEAARQVGDHA